MNKNNVSLVAAPVLPLAELSKVVVALGDLVDAWTPDTQACFEAVVANGANGLGEWDIPSLDEVHAQLLGLFGVFNSVNSNKSYARTVS